MPYTSKHGDAFVPNVTLTDYVLARADAAPAGATAFTDGPSGRAVAYSSLRAHVSSVAAGLWQRGLRKGDVLALFMPNHPECGSMDKVLSRQRASSGRPWRLLAARHSQGEAGPLGAQLLPRVLELAASKVADFTAFDHSGRPQRLL